MFWHLDITIKIGVQHHLWGVLDVVWEANVGNRGPGITKEARFQMP